MKLIHVSAGGDYLLNLNFERDGISKALFANSQAQIDSRWHVSLERLTAPPEGNFKEDNLSDKEAARASAIAPAQPRTPIAVAAITKLSDDDIADAVLQGEHDKGSSQIGLLLEDATTAFVTRALDPNRGVSGFSMRLLTAKQWIELQAAESHRLMKPFTIADVKPEWQNDVLYAIGLPNKPDHLNGENIAASSSVEHVVLLPLDSDEPIQPIDEAPINMTLDSALRSRDYSGIEASFPKPDLRQEFRVAVIGEGGSKKIFTVKQKYLSRLR